METHKTNEEGNSMCGEDAHYSTDVDKWVDCSKCLKIMSKGLETIEVKKENKFFVVHRKYIEDLPPEIREMFEDAVDYMVSTYRIHEKKYVCCNQDEPYAEEVWQRILKGEREKTQK